MPRRRPAWNRGCGGTEQAAQTGSAWRRPLPRVGLREHRPQCGELWHASLGWMGVVLTLVGAKGTKDTAQTRVHLLGWTVGRVWCWSHLVRLRLGRAYSSTNEYEWLNTATYPSTQAHNKHQVRATPPVSRGRACSVSVATRTCCGPMWGVRAAKLAEAKGNDHSNPVSPVCYWRVWRLRRGGP